ncbi:MAG: response regulator transcription factor [Cyclobacteriaceae bacterium]
MLNEKKIEVSIIDNDQLYLQGLVQLVACCYDLNVHSSSTSANEVVNQYHSSGPDVLVMSLKSDDMDIVQVNRFIKEHGFSTRVVVCEKFDPGPLLKLLLNSGVCTYVLKEFLSKSDLARVIREVHRNGYANTRLVSHELLESLYPVSKDSSIFLSDRERQVLFMTCNGLSRRQIADELRLKEATIKFHLDKLRERFNCQTVVQLVSKSMKSGAVKLDSLSL